MVGQLEHSILFADEDIVVLNKPAGVVVNQAQANREPSLQEWFIQEYLPSRSLQSVEWQSLLPPEFDGQYGSPEDIWSERQGIVHRLDKDTSGILLLALNPGSLVHLLRQFQQRQVHKKYVCLVHGGISLAKGIINAPLQRAQKDRRRFAVTAGGREAVTQYEVTQRFSHLKPIQPALQSSASVSDLTSEELKVLRANRDTYSQGFSLVECEPKTGRTHQIRVHLAHLKHPIVGDSVYVGKKRAKLDALWCHRQFLHAEQLAFTHPRTGEALQFAAPLPTDLVSVLQLLE